LTGGVKELDMGQVDQVLDEGDRLVILEFYTDNCAFCAAVAPVYQQLSNELANEAVFTRINAAQNSQLAQRFGVRGTPTFKFFCRGRPIGDLVGEMNITLLRNSIKDFIRHRLECVSKSTPLVTELDGY
jgi:thiol-disulfide isomerase/thioredoxin